jgi:hypothetical protein
MGGDLLKQQNRLVHFVIKPAKMRESADLAFLHHKGSSHSLFFSWSSFAVVIRGRVNGDRQRKERKATEMKEEKPKALKMKEKKHIRRKSIKTVKTIHWLPLSFPFILFSMLRRRNQMSSSDFNILAGI